MKILEKKINNDKRKITYLVQDHKTWQKVIDETIKNMIDKGIIKGFRKGALSKEMALKFVDKQEIIRRAKTKGIYKIYDKFMSSMLIPKYEILESEIVGDLTEANMNYATIAYEFDQFPDIKLPNIDELQLNYEPPQVSEFEINDFVDEITKNDIVFKEKDMDATVDLDNIVFVDASYHHEGTEIKDLKKNNAPLHVIDLDVNIENNSQTFFIDNFAKQLIGHKVGQSVNVTIFYPNNDIYGFCSGKKIDVKVKINKILLIQSRPTLSNSYVYELGVGNVNNAKKLMAHAKKQIFLQKDRIIRKKLYEQIGSFINTAKVEFIPQWLIDEEIKRIDDSLEKTAFESHKTKIEHLATLGIVGTEKTDYFLKLSAINNISAALITEQLFDKYKITVTQKEVDEFIENLANEYGYDIKTTKEKLRNDFSYIESLSAHRKLLDYLIVKCSKHKPK